MDCEGGGGVFGYVKPFQPELKIKEFDTYKAVYCGLCKQLGRSFGPFSRFTLSYDFAFLAMLDMALEEGCPTFKRERCFVNPLKKKFCCCENPSQDFSAAAAMVMVYYKVKDNLQDEGLGGRIGAGLLYPMAASARKKAAGRYPQLDGVISRMYQEQGRLEQEGCSSIDQAAEPTAKAMSALCGMLTREGQDSRGQRRILERLGYLLGRWIYLVDAMDDLEEDMRKRRYNPFVLSALSAQDAGREPDTAGLSEERLPADFTARLDQLTEKAAGSVNLTMGEIANAYELLELNRYKSILDNVIYLGLKDVANSIRFKKKEQRHDRSV